MGELMLASIPEQHQYNYLSSQVIITLNYQIDCLLLFQPEISNQQKSTDEQQMSDSGWLIRLRKNRYLDSVEESRSSRRPMKRAYSLDYIQSHGGTDNHNHHSRRHRSHHHHHSPTTRQSLSTTPLSIVNSQRSSQSVRFKQMLHNDYHLGVFYRSI